MAWQLCLWVSIQEEYSSIPDSVQFAIPVLWNLLSEAVGVWVSVVLVEDSDTTDPILIAVTVKY